jgi:RecJ-like exonuclease
MEKEVRNLEIELKNFSQDFLKTIKGRRLQIVSHFDTDGITSARIMIGALKRLDQSFDLKIVKNLTREFISSLSPIKVTLFLDLASGSLKEIGESQLKEVFIVDHHEIQGDLSPNVRIINPELCDKQKISGAGMTYLFCKEIDLKNKEFAKFAVLGTIGDSLEKDLDAVNHGILEDSEVKRKKGILIYPSTRPINRVLEYCSDPLIPGVTGNPEGVLELMREINLTSNGGKCKSFMELDEAETERVVTAIMLRNPQIKNKEIIGELFLVKMFGKLEDAREMSAKINACSRNGDTDIALRFCMEDNEAKKKAEAIHVKYKQQLLSGIKYIQEEAEKIQGRGYIILNAKDKVKDTIIGTITSILSHSAVYDQETILIGMAYDKENIKISARSVGRKGRNIREILSNIAINLNGEVGGHEFAAGCTINKEHEQEFLKNLRRDLDLEVVKI